MTRRGCIGVIVSVLGSTGCEATEARNPFDSIGPGLGGGEDADGDTDAEGDESGDAESGTSGGEGPPPSSEGGSSAGEESGGEESGGEPRFCDDGEVWSAAFSDQAVPQVEDAYVCRGFTLQSDGLRHAIAFSAVIDNPAHIHHMVLHRVPSALPGGSQACEREPDWQFMFGWAPGSGDFVLPPEAGFLVGDGTGGQTHFVLEAHYNNPLEVAGQVDASGVQVCLTPELRPNNAGLFALGKISDIEIPPGEPAWTESHTCPSQLTAAALAGGSLTVFGSMAHGHLLARSIRTEQFRGGQYIGDLGREDMFDFNNQKIVPIEGQVLAGDELVTTCVYDSTSRNDTTYGGEGTHDEMCLNSLAYYPALPLLGCL